MNVDEQRLGKVADRFLKLDAERAGVLSIARECASLSVPSLLPPDGHREDTELKPPHQSDVARGVISLGSRIVMSLFPPAVSFFKITPDADVMRSIKEAYDAGYGEQFGAPDFETAKSVVLSSLNDITEAVMQEFETRGLRDAIQDLIPKAMVAKSAVLYIPPDDRASVYRLDRAVMRRDGSGKLLELILLDHVDPSELPVEMADETEKMTKGDTSVHQEGLVEVYTCVKRERDGYYVSHQETRNGTEIPKSRGRHKELELPWIVVSWTPDGDYGRSHVENNLGACRTHEGNQRALDSSTAMAARKVVLQRPGVTRTKSVEAAANGDIVAGNPDEFGLLEFGNIPEMDSLAKKLEDSRRVIMMTFLDFSMIQRQGDRVTATEINQMVEQLQSVLGSVYVNFAADLQLPIIHRLMFILRQRGKLPELPKAVHVIIKTGLDGLSNLHDLQKLSQLLSITQPHPKLSDRLNPGEVIIRLCNALEINPTGLFITDDEAEAAQQQQQEQDMMSKVAGPIAGNASRGLFTPNAEGQV